MGWMASVAGLRVWKPRVGTTAASGNANELVLLPCPSLPLLLPRRHDAKESTLGRGDEGPSGTSLTDRLRPGKS